MSKRDEENKRLAPTIIDLIRLQEKVEMLSEWDKPLSTHAGDLDAVECMEILDDNYSYGEDE